MSPLLGLSSGREGTIHYVTAGAGDPVLLLHQTPRSWDEYRDVIPPSAENFSVIAMDTLGFGDSEKPSRPSSVEGYGRAVVAFLDALGIERTSIVGHHTGGVVAVEVAATHPDRVNRLVLSGTTCVDEEGREGSPRSGTDRPCGVQCRWLASDAPLAESGCRITRPIAPTCCIDSFSTACG